MFKLSNATIHYGSHSHEFHGLEKKFGQIENLDALDLEALSVTIGRITGFPVPMKAQLCPEFDVAGIVEAQGEVYPDHLPRVIPERIVAMGNGYTITWNRA